ncbi:MAG: tetratricopeptide repeat protein [Thermodesulfobacteriota bacterium]
MRVISVVLVAVFLFCAAGLAQAAGDSLKEAQRLYDAGKYKKAESMAKGLVAQEPDNAGYHQLLGDIYKRETKLEKALAEYKKAESLGIKSAELYKDIGTTYKWLGDSSTAVKYYKKALRVHPGDREAKSDLAQIRRSKGLGISLMAGGWEPDYTTSAYELMLSYSGIKDLDLYAGYGFADQVYYDRTKYYAKGYYFYAPGSYFKVNPQFKDYDYPTSKVPTPDANSYDKVPSVELELQHWVTGDFRVNVAYEFFRPSFFHDTGSHATNHKVTTELYYMTPLKYLRFKLIYAILRDPDPDRTAIIGRDDPNTPVVDVAAATDIVYQTEQFLGGAVEYVRGRWDAEVKYMPNRDLDSSYDYSLLTKLGYRFTDRLAGRLDYVYDKYSTKSNFSGETAGVYMASAYYKLTPGTDIGAGLKYLDLPAGKDTTGFLTLRYKTGIGF